MQQSKGRAFTSYVPGLANVLTNEVQIGPAYNIAGRPVVFSTYTAIWDTGATNTVITSRVAQECNLSPITMRQVRGVNGTSRQNVHLVNIRLPGKVEITEIQVTEAAGLGEADVLIGMDIIGAGDFAVSNFQGRTTFTFRVPSQGCIDFLPPEQRPKLPSDQPAMPKVGRNALCPCGSGEKYKKCHGAPT